MPFSGPWLRLAAMATKPDARASAGPGGSGRTGLMATCSSALAKEAGRRCPAKSQSRLTRLAGRERTSGLAGLGRRSFSK